LRVYSFSGPSFIIFSWRIFFLFQTVGTCIVEECKENKLWEMTKKMVRIVKGEQISDSVKNNSFKVSDTITFNLNQIERIANRFIIYAILRKIYAMWENCCFEKSHLTLRRQNTDVILIVQQQSKQKLIRFSPSKIPSKYCQKYPQKYVSTDLSNILTDWHCPDSIIFKLKINNILKIF